MKHDDAEMGLAYYHQIKKQTKTVDKNIHTGKIFKENFIFKVQPYLYLT